MSSRQKKDVKIQLLVNALNNISNADKIIFDSIFDKNILSESNEQYTSNYFIVEILRILTLSGLADNSVRVQSIDDVLEYLKNDLDINNILSSKLILNNIVNNINDKSNYNIQYKSINDLHQQILRIGIFNYLSDKYEDINAELQSQFDEFIKDDNVYNILEQAFSTIENAVVSTGNDSNNTDIEYTYEQLEAISKLSIDDLSDKFNSDLEITDVAQSAIVEADFLYHDINQSYRKLAGLILGSIVNTYNEREGIINNYNQFLNFLYDNFLGLQLSDFILCRRTIINYDNDFNHIDPIVDYIINTYIQSEFPEDKFQECNLRKTGAERIDEVLEQVASDYLDECIQYIFDRSRTENNNFIDIYLNKFLEKKSNYINDNIQKQSFADILKKKQGNESTESAESVDSAELITSTEIQDTVDNTQIDINDPNTWDIKTLMNKLGTTTVTKTIYDTINTDQLFFPTVKVNNNNCFQRFIHDIRLHICNVLKQDNKINSIKTKEELIKIIEDKIDNLNNQYIINTRNTILKDYNDNNDPKIDAIIGNLNSELKKKLNIKNDYLIYPKPLYLIVLQYLQNSVYLNEIKKAFINKFRNDKVYKDRIIYSSNKQNNIQNIHYMYLKFFPLILINDLYSKDIKTLSYMFSTSQLNKVIENNLQHTEELFLPKNNEYYREFTQMLIQKLLHNLGTISQKASGNKRELREIFAILRQRYNDLLENEYNGDDLNSMANKVRSLFFESYKNIQDPLILNIITQLFPDLEFVDIDTQSTLAKSLSKYILETNGSAFSWHNLKSYFQKITVSVFHENYDADNLDSACYNTVFLNAVDTIQSDKKYYSTRPFREAIKNHQQRDTSLPIQSDSVNKIIDNNVNNNTDDNNTDNNNTDNNTDNNKNLYEDININDLTLDQLNKLTNNKISEIINLESSFLPAQLLSLFCNIIIKGICNDLKDMHISTQKQLYDAIKQLYIKLISYKNFMRIRNNLLQKKQYSIDPLIDNINKQIPTLPRISINSKLYKDIIQHINTDLFKHFIEIIGNKYILDINNTLYMQYYPDIYITNNNSNTSVTNDNTNNKDTNDNNDINISIDNNKNNLNNESEDINQKSKSRLKSRTMPKRSHFPKLRSRLKNKNDKLVQENNSNIELNKNNTSQLNINEIQSYVLDDFTIIQLEQLIHSYNSSFNIDNEIIKAAIGHIESFNGESYKRIFKPLFEGTFAKQLPTKKFAESLLKKVQLTTLITNERNRFAEFLRIFLFNISDNKHKFFIREVMNQRTLFNKQIRDYLLHNTNIINKINQRLYAAFDKYYNAYFDNALNNKVYNMAFDTLAKANSINDSKGDVHQFKDYSLKNKILIVNDQVYVFNINKSFEEYLYDLNIHESIYNYAQGYIIKNCVFLDPLINCSEEEVANILINDPSKNIQKVYLTINNDNNILTERRLAKLINKRLYN